VLTGRIVAKMQGKPAATARSSWSEREEERVAIRARSRHAAGNDVASTGRRCSRAEHGRADHDLRRFRLLTRIAAEVKGFDARAVIDDRRLL
jgi:hypothetical protein